MKAKIFLTLALCSALAGCIKDNRVGPSSVEEKIEKSFDFKPTFPCAVTLRYDRSGYIEVYAENPVDENGVLTGDRTPVYTAFIPKSGVYTGTMELPKYLLDRTVYLYSPSVGIPWLTTATITSSGLTVDNAAAAPRSRADDAVFTPLSDKLIAAIEATVPEGRNNEKKITSHNTSVKVTEDCEIDVVFVHERTSATNTFTYFWYPTDTPPSSRKQIDATNSAVLFPAMKYGELKSGQTLRLKYFDGKEWTTRFPAGVTVGWMIHQPRFIAQNPNAYFTSLQALNPGGKPQTVAFRDEESQMLVYGFEDWFYNGGDKDFNDVLFSVKATPFDAIDNEDFPSLDEGKDTTGEQTTGGTLLFEDLYPAEGDYDLNDVVVEYVVTKYFNKFNNTTRIRGTYTPKSVPGSAGLPSGFGFVIDDAQIASATVNGAAYPLDATQDIILYQSGKDAEPVYEVEIELSGPVNKDELTAPFNPFIFVGDRSAGREVHLTKMKPTDKADQTGLDEFRKHYITQSNYPFAMNVPVLDFRQVSEKVRIDEEYPDFTKWIADGKVQWWKKKID